MFDWLLVATLALSPTAAEPVPAVVVPPAAQVMEIPAPLREALQREVIARSPRGLARLERLVAFLYDPEGLDIRYRHDADHTVAETWATRQANCLSFTLLTIALAREAGLEAYGQEIPRTLSWYSEGDTLYFSNHVNAGIRVGRHEYTVDVASDSLLTRDPPTRVDDGRLLAVYYSNRGVSLLADGDLAGTERYIAAALAADPGYASGWNNAGVLQLRTGARTAAEADFRQALDLDGGHEGALMNMAALSEARGDRAAAAQKRGDYASAATHYRQAIHLHEGEHRFHFGLARAWLHLGEARKAGRALRRAHDLAKGETRLRYQAKLDALNAGRY
jgi:Flp pilus assembly protein TadD